MAESSNWKVVGRKNHHGVNIPLFSLRSQQSSGIGEYLDLIPIIRWCKTIGFDVIQTLPLNDSGLDPSPYNALSAFALHPIFLSLAQLPEVEGDNKLQAQLADLRRLNDSDRVDYQAVVKGKNAFLESYYAEYASEFLASKAYLEFCEQNKGWLETYAHFKALKEANDWKVWDEWHVESVDPHRVTFHMLIQFLCFKQMQQVKQEASANGVFLKGDIPILLSRDSADVWCHRDQFNLDFCAGAPPDYYAVEGQKWGFPLYNWKAIEETGFSWWKERLKLAQQLYDIYRIDHIVGFFRIWAIPLNAPAKEGKMVPEDLNEALAQGSKILGILQSTTEMLPIGEDLGVVPLEVRAIMQEMGICGTKVMRWERRWNTDRGFIDPKDYSELSMTTLSTHDSDLVKQWWSDLPEDAKVFAAYKNWEYEPLLSVEHNREMLRDSHNSGSLFHINLLQEYLTLFPELSWPQISDERVNVPGVQNAHNWTYRFKPRVEEIVNHKPLAEMMRSFVSQQGETVSQEEPAAIEAVFPLVPIALTEQVVEPVKELPQEQTPAALEQEAEAYKNEALAVEKEEVPLVPEHEPAAYEKETVAEAQEEAPTAPEQEQPIQEPTTLEEIEAVGAKPQKKKYEPPKEELKEEEIDIFEL